MLNLKIIHASTREGPRVAGLEMGGGCGKKGNRF